MCFSYGLVRCNGRQSNKYSPTATVAAAKYTAGYADVILKWNLAADDANPWSQNVSNLADGWSDAWYGIKNGRAAADVASVKALGLPVIGTPGEDLIMLDSTAITKWNLNLNDGGKASGAIDKTFDLLFKKIQIGDKLAEGSSDEYVFGKTAGFVGKEIVKGKKITPNVGTTFTFEGNGTMVNILGQVVATGAGSIDASALAEGIYYIIIEGVASNVIVD